MAELLDTSNLEADLEAALNLSELRRRRFRAIAQIAGLMNRGYPGSSKSTGQLQIGASLLFDVFGTNPAICCCNKRAVKYSMISSSSRLQQA